MVALPPKEELKAKATQQAQKLLALAKSTAHKLQQDLDKVEILQKAEETTKIPKGFMVGAVVLLGLSLFMFNSGAQFIVNIVGFVFPAYASFRAIEQGDSTEGKVWLAYWVGFGGLNLLDFFADFITYWLPFYYLLKLAAVIYLIHPKFRGAVQLKKIVLKIGTAVSAKLQ